MVLYPEGVESRFSLKRDAAAVQLTFNCVNGQGLGGDMYPAVDIVNILSAVIKSQSGIPDIHNSLGIRIVPGAFHRSGDDQISAQVGKRVIEMPCCIYRNIGIQTKRYGLARPGFTADIKGSFLKKGQAVLGDDNGFVLNAKLQVPAFDNGFPAVRSAKVRKKQHRPSGFSAR